MGILRNIELMMNQQKVTTPTFSFGSGLLSGSFGPSTQQTQSQASLIPSNTAYLFGRPQPDVTLGIFNSRPQTSSGTQQHQSSKPPQYNSQGKLSLHVEGTSANSNNRIIKQQLKDLEGVVQNDEFFIRAMSAGSTEASKIPPIPSQKGVSRYSGKRTQAQSNKGQSNMNDLRQVLTTSAQSRSRVAEQSRSSTNNNPPLEGWQTTNYKQASEAPRPQDTQPLNLRPGTAAAVLNERTTAKKGSTINSSPQRLRQGDLVDFSRQALRSMERKHDMNMPLHLKHTIFSMSKTIDKGERSSPPRLQVHDQDVKDAIMDFQVRVSQSVDTHDPSSHFASKKNSQKSVPKALLRMKIVEFHKTQEVPSLQNRIPASYSSTTVGFGNVKSTTSLLPSKGPMRKNRHTEALQTKEARFHSTNFLAAQNLISERMIPTADEDSLFGYQMDHQNQPQSLEDLILPPEAYMNKEHIQEDKATLPRAVSKDHLPSPVDYQRLNRYSTVQRPFSVPKQHKELARIRAIQQISSAAQTKNGKRTQKPLAIKQHGEKQKAAVSLSSGDENMPPSNQQQSIFQTQFVPPTTVYGQADYQATQRKTVTPKNGSVEGELTRQQIFNYLHVKKGKRTAPYGIIEREEEIFDEIVENQKKERAAKELTRPFSSPGKLLSSQTLMQSEGAGEGPILVRQETSATALVNRQISENQMHSRHSSPQKLSQHEVRSNCEYIDHTTDKFIQQINDLIKQTPLLEVLKEAKEKEKKFPTFIYVPPQPSKYMHLSNWTEIMGEDIGFEQGQSITENEKRQHMRLLNNLLIDILSGGRYRDQEWFGGIIKSMHAQKDSEGIYRTDFYLKIQKYIEGQDLAKIFKEKMKQSLKLDARGISPDKASIQWSSPADDPRILDQGPFKQFLRVITEKIGEKQKTEAAFAEMFQGQNTFLVDVDNYMSKEKPTEGEGEQKLTEKEEKRIDAIETIKSVANRHMKIAMQQAREHQRMTQEKHEAELEEINKFMDMHMQLAKKKKKDLKDSGLTKLGQLKLGGTLSGTQPQSIGATAIAFALRKAFSPEKQKRSKLGEASKDEITQRSMIYMCFLEIVRQVSIKQKDQGILLLKVWHAYFDQFDHDIDRLVSSIKHKQKELDQILNNMREAFQDIVWQKEKTEQHFFDLTQRIEELQKDLNVSRLIQKGDAELRKEAQEHFKRMKVIFPNCEHYLDKIKVKTLDQTNAGYDRMAYLNKSLGRKEPSATDIYLLEDLDRVMASIASEPVYCLNLRYDHMMYREAVEKVEYDSNIRFNYLETLLVEKVSELREYDYKRAYAEDKDIQTDMRMKDLHTMLQKCTLQPPQQVRSRAQTIKYESTESSGATTEELLHPQTAKAHLEAFSPMIGHNPITPQSSNALLELTTPNKRSLMQKNSISNLMGSMSKMHDKSAGGRGSNLKLPRASVQVDNSQFNASPYSILDPTAYNPGGSAAVRKHQASSPAVHNATPLANQQITSQKKVQFNDAQQKAIVIPNFNQHQDQANTQETPSNGGPKLHKQNTATKGDLMKFLQNRFIDDHEVPLEEWKQADVNNLKTKVKIKHPHKIQEVSSSESEMKKGKSINSQDSIKSDKSRPTEFDIGCHETQNSPDAFETLKLKKVHSEVNVLDPMLQGPHQNFKLNLMDGANLFDIQEIQSQGSKGNSQRKRVMGQSIMANELEDVEGSQYFRDNPSVSLKDDQSPEIELSLGGARLTESIYSVSTHQSPPLKGLKSPSQILSPSML